MVKFLIEQKANPYITSTPQEGEEETVLETACRWNYLAIIKYYLSTFAWDTQVLKKSLKLCSSEGAKMEVKRYLKKGLFGWM